MDSKVTSDFDVLVQWEDDSLNVVSSNDLKLHGGRWRCGALVSMLWKDGVEYTGKIVDMELVVSDTDSDDDIPLSRIDKRQRIQSDIDTDGEDDNAPLSRFSKKDQHHQIPSPQQIAPACSHPHCSGDAVVSCLNALCSSLVCEDHFVGENSCIVCDKQDGNASSTHETDILGPYVTDVQKAFPVEGCRKEESSLNRENIKKKEAQRKVVKRNRNKGLSYESEKSKKVIPAREMKGRCKGKSCTERSLRCAEISEDRRAVLFKEFWNIGDLTRQRNWVHAQISSVNCTSSRKEDSRRTKTILYNLPDENGQKIPVCQKLFLHTLDISQRFIRTVCSKVDENGILDGEHRGGRLTTLKKKDEAVREAITNHIDSFPRTESHYCRQNTKREYLNSNLTISMMYSMFKEKHPEISADYTTYRKVFKTMNLSFHKPKKDLCGLCESYYTGTDAKRNELQHQMRAHLLEKEEVRKLKNTLKDNQDPSVVLATFDLEQVIYLPKSNRCEVFYRRQLANYNFTIYDVKTKECYAYLWHECIAKRGSNEIASCLLNFLQEKDTEGASNIYLFCDSCSGQNRNTTLPSMLLYFICNTKSIVSITINFFEPHHGQNEGDSVHSSVERALRRHNIINLPSELAPIVRSSRTAPTHVKQIVTEDVRDWKDLSRNLGILKVREADDGKLVDWTTVKSVTVRKSRPLQIGFKLSHMDPNYSYLCIGSQRTRREVVYPPLAHSNPPKLPKAKYEDLMALIQCDTPLISHPDHQNFYQNLAH